MVNKISNHKCLVFRMMLSQSEQSTAVSDGNEHLLGCQVCVPGVVAGPEDDKVRAVKQTRIICMHLGERLGKAVPSKEGQT